MRKSLFAILSLMSLAAFAQQPPKNCHDKACVGDRIVNYSPTRTDEIFGHVDALEKYQYTITWDSGRTEKVSWVGKVFEYSECADDDGVKICVGDKTMIMGNTGEVNMFYVEFLGTLKGRGSMGKIIGRSEVVNGQISDGKSELSKSIVTRRGKVPGLDNLEFGQKISNGLGSQDYIVAHAGRRYFVFHGDLGVAKTLYKHELIERLQLTPSKDVNEAAIGKKCPDFRGEYENKGCETSRDVGLTFFPYSKWTTQPSNRVIVEQIGCEQVYVTYDLAWKGNRDSVFSPEAEGRTSGFDLTKKAKIKKNSVAVHISASEGAISGPSECMPIPYAYYEKRTQDYKLALDGDVLSMDAKYVSMGISLIVPFRDVDTVSCGMVKVK